MPETAAIVGWPQRKCEDRASALHLHSFWFPPALVSFVRVGRRLAADRPIATERGFVALRRTCGGRR